MSPVAPPPVVLPRPAVLVADGGRTAACRWRLTEIDHRIDDLAATAQRLLAQLAPAGSARQGHVRAAWADLPPEGYTVRIGAADLIEVTAADGRGVLHAIRSIAQLADADGTVAFAEIADHPQLGTRGVFVESFWGTDRMGRDDWIELVDRAAELKLNTLGVSIYGCWDMRHDRDRGEFLMVPLSRYPHLRTPHRMRTWDTGSAQVIDLEYSPKMFEENLLADVVGHARQVGVEVIPFVAGPGHSSLVPRLLPRLSARSSDGEPSGYGYCLTDPDARAALREFWEALVDEHIAPNGISRVGVQGDEFYAVRNLDPNDPLRTIDPVCRCPGCAPLGAGGLLVEYLDLVGHVLDAAGVGLVHWHDSLVREQTLDRYADLVVQRDRDVALAWWGYNDPLPVPDADRPWHTWVTPTPGLIASLFTQDFTVNIEQWLHRAHQVGADGVLAYTTYGAGAARQFAALADLAWNLSESGGRSGTTARWASTVGGDRARDVELGLTVADTVLASYPLMNYLLQQTLPYFATSPAGTIDYVGDLVRALSVPFPAMPSVIRQSADTLRESLALMPSAGRFGAWGDAVGEWRLEVLRMANHLDLVGRAIALARRTHHENIGSLLPDLADWQDDAVRELDRVVASAPERLAVVTGREHLELVTGLEGVLRAMVDGRAARPSTQPPWHAWLF